VFLQNFHLSVLVRISGKINLTWRYFRLFIFNLINTENIYTAVPLIFHVVRIPVEGTPSYKGRTFPSLLTKTHTLCYQPSCHICVRAVRDFRSMVSQDFASAVETEGCRSATDSVGIIATVVGFSSYEKSFSNGLPISEGE
jgi:hypothetical protein